MNTNFFQTLATLKVEGDWKITIKLIEDDQWLVSVLFANERVGDDARKIVPPMILKGTAAELDGGFFTAIETPVKQTAALFANMRTFLAGLDEAKRQSKMEQEKTDKDKKDAEERRKRFETQMKKVAELEEKEKYGEAIGQMPKADQFPEQAEEIKKKHEELRSNHGQLSLL